MRRSTGRPPEPTDAIDVLKAMADPMRLSILQQMARADELACTTLERTLPLTKPTISYHIKVLHQAGLVAVRKEGRHYFYTLRRETLDRMLPNLSENLQELTGAWSDPDEQPAPH